MFDVIVIGAGPAGCCAAKTLAERGRSVLLVERFALPRYKSCSGVLIKKTLELTERYFGAAAPELSMCDPAENRGMIFTDDKGREYRFEQDGRNVWRSEYDNWLAQKAVSVGAELRDNTAAVDLAEFPDGVEVTFGGSRRYIEKARYVIDCEGVVGAFKRRITKTAGVYVTTYQTFNDGTIDLDPHYFYAYLQPQLSEYDAWFNVKDNKLVLGVSVRDTSNIARYYAGFLEYMRKSHGLKVTSQLKEEKWLMPLIRPGFVIEYAIGRTFFAGETAGFLNPMGEGISAALESGHAAACAVDEYFLNPERAAQEYQAALSPLRTYMERQWRFVGSIAGTFAEFRR